MKLHTDIFLKVMGLILFLSGQVISGISQQNQSPPSPQKFQPPPPPKQSPISEWVLSDTIMNHTKPLPFRMWVGPATKHIRGLIVAPKVWAEEDFVNNPAIRKVAAEEDLAIIKTDGKNFAMFDITKGEDTLFLRVLHKIAVLSGFPEIEFAPWLTFGHSTAGHFAKNLAFWKPERTFGILYFKSGQFHSPSWTKPGTSLHNIPILFINGQFEEFGPHGQHAPGESPESQWRAVRDTLMLLRKSNYLVSFIVAPGEGHFALTQRVADYMALFIKKAAYYKIPRNTITTNGSINLNEIKESSGFLSDTCISALTVHPDKRLINVIQPYKKFPTKEISFWHFDDEIAQAWLKFYHP